MVFSQEHIAQGWGRHMKGAMTSRLWWVTQRVGTLCRLHRGEGYGGLAEVAHARYPFLLRCHKPMLECTRIDVRDGIGWKCSSCKTHRPAVQEGSFFAKSQLTLQTWVMLLHFWSCQNPVSDTAECSKGALNTAVDVYQWFREVCSTRFINDGPVMLGSSGVIVQIYESIQT